MNKTLKECSKCKKYYDFNNINFCLNVAISKKMEVATEDDKKYLIKLNSLMQDSTGINWCTCNTKEKKEKIKEAELFLEKINISQKKDEESLGFDFKLKEDVVYFKNEHNFKNTIFLKFIKSLKSKLKEDQLLEFDYLDFDKITARDFNYKKYYSTPNYLLIYDFENLKEDNIDILIKLNNIIKQRKSNNKKIFIVSNNNINKIEKFMITRFFTKDEYIVLEFINLIKNEFKHKKITTVEKTNSINTSNIRKQQTKSSPKKAEESKEIYI